MKRAVVLGGSGFIGRYLCARLKSGGWAVSVLDREDRGVASDEFHRVDSRDPDQVAALVRPGDFFVHLIHSSIPVESMDNPTVELTENALPYIALLEKLADAGASLVVYSSSGGQIYGHGGGRPLTEDSPCRPVSAYGASKLTMELFTRLCTARRGLDHLIVRVGNPYGPGQELTNRHGAIPALMRAAARGAGFTVYGGGRTVRDYIYIEDAAEAVARLMESARNQTVNVGTGRGVSLRELIGKVEAVSGRRIAAEDKPIRKTDVLDNVLDVSLLHQLTGYRAPTSLDIGLARTWERFDKP